MICFVSQMNCPALSLSTKNYNQFLPNLSLCRFFFFLSPPHTRSSSSYLEEESQCVSPHSCADLGCCSFDLESIWKYSYDLDNYSCFSGCIYIGQVASDFLSACIHNGQFGFDRLLLHKVLWNFSRLSECIRFDQGAFDRFLRQVLWNYSCNQLLKAYQIYRNKNLSITHLISPTTRWKWKWSN